MSKNYFFKDNLLGYIVLHFKQLMVSAFIIGGLACMTAIQIMEPSNEVLYSFILAFSLMQSVIAVIAMIVVVAGTYFNYSNSIFGYLLPAPFTGTCLSAQLTAWVFTGFSTEQLTLLYLIVGICVTLIYIYIAQETVKHIKTWIHNGETRI